MQLKTLLLFMTTIVCAAMLHVQTTYVFVGTFNRDKNKEGIVVYKLDHKSGKLTKVYVVSGILNPSFLAIGADSNYLYACTESQTKNSGYINSFKFDPATGRLTEKSRQKTSGENPVFLTTDRDNRFLLSVNYTEAGLDVFPIDAKGATGDRIQTIAYQEGSHATERQNIAHCHSVIFSPDFSNIFIPDLGADVIRTYKFNAALPQPVVADSYMEYKAAPASGPRHICFHPDGKHVYCVEEIGGSLSSYAFDHGKLRLLERLMLHQGNWPYHNSADVHVSPDGKFLYASNRGEENNIEIFAIAADGRLRFVASQAVHGEHPRMFGVSPAGDYLVVANQLSNNLCVFKRDKHTGKLKATGQRIKIEAPSCVQIKTYGSIE